MSEWVSVSEGAGGGGRREAEGGYRTKNKNPTRQCGEQSEGGSHIVPRLPRKTSRRHSAAWEPSAPLEPAQCHKCHACHVK